MHLSISNDPQLCQAAVVAEVGDLVVAAEADDSAEVSSHRFASLMPSV
jgi:hypothetical protein